MASSSFYKFQDFVERLVKGEFQFHAAGHTVKVYLTNNTPSASADAVKTDLAGITEQNGYTAADIQQDISETSGVMTMTGVDVEWTASGGSFGPFRYAVLYDEDHASDALIGYYDYGSEITIATGEKFKVDFGASILTLS
jgi:hypothetical protein